MPHALDPSLQSVIRDLAALQGEDVADILAILDGEQRVLVEQMLRAHGDVLARDVPVSGDAAQAFDPAQLSGWLRKILDCVALQKSAMTTLAGQTLLECVAEAHPLRGRA